MARSRTEARKRDVLVQMTAPHVRSLRLDVVDVDDERDEDETKGVALELTATRTARNEVRSSVTTSVTGHPRVRLSATMEIGVRVQDDGEAPIDAVSAALAEALERDSVPYVYPYVRELISSLTTRAVGHALLLPVVAPSEMRVTDVAVPPFEASEADSAEVSRTTGAKPSPSRKKAG